jgi:hypothetical protein
LIDLLAAKFWSGPDDRTNSVTALAPQAGLTGH